MSRAASNVDNKVTVLKVGRRGSIHHAKTQDKWREQHCSQHWRADRMNDQGPSSEGIHAYKTRERRPEHERMSLPLYVYETCTSL